MRDPIRSGLTTECPTGTCPKGANGDLDAYHTMATVSTATLIAMSGTIQTRV